MPTIAKKSGVEVARSNPSTLKGPDLASESVPDTLAALHVKQETGLTALRRTPAGRSTATMK